MRIAIGLVVLSDLIIRSQSIIAHYTSEGVLPVSLMMEFDYKPLHFSLHNLNDGLLWQSVLFIFHAIITLFLIFGYQTKLYSVLAWLFMVSLQNRDPYIQQGGDDLLRLVLFWGMFIPWGNFYSLDSKNNSGNTSGNKYLFSVSSMGYLLLIASVYFFSALSKTSPEWRSEGTAVYYALSLDQLKLGMGNWLYQFPGLMKLLTHFVFYTELFAPVLLLFPFKNKFFRIIAVILILTLHTGIALNLYVGLFFVIGISSTLGLLPSSFMDMLERQIKDSRLKIKDSSYKSNVTKNNFNKFFKSGINIFLGLVLAVCLLINLTQVKGFGYKLNYKVGLFSNALKLEQYWGMFSPFIYKNDGWYLFIGYKQDNSAWDIYNNKPDIDRTKPKSIVKMFESDRWRKLAENFEKREFNFMKPYYCRYLLKKWNNEHPDNKMGSLNILFMKEESLPDYKTKPVVQENKCLCTEGE